jgi:hypothetical protein
MVGRELEVVPLDELEVLARDRTNPPFIDRGLVDQRRCVLGRPERLTGGDEFPEKAAALQRGDAERVL